MSWVYLAKSGDGTTLKIGCTSNPNRRMRQLRQHAIGVLKRDVGHFTLIHSMRGGHRLEVTMQDYFIPRFGRIGSEWFSFSDEIVDFFIADKRPPKLKWWDQMLRDRRAKKKRDEHAERQRIKWAAREAEWDKRDRDVADTINAGKCPFGNLSEGQTMAHCPSGFPGCGCGDELICNPHLAQVMVCALEHERKEGSA